VGTGVQRGSKKGNARDTAKGTPDLCAKRTGNVEAPLLARVGDKPRKSPKKVAGMTEVDG